MKLLCKWTMPAVELSLRPSRCWRVHCSFSFQGLIRGVSSISLLVESVVSARRFDAKDNDLLQASTWCRSLYPWYIRSARLDQFSSKA